MKTQKSHWRSGARVLPLSILAACVSHFLSVLILQPQALLAQKIVINELLAYPPPSRAGDANGDGRRHGKEDEFIELVNAGTHPVDLGGWTLRDADLVRHIFPARTILDPGRALVVFGGGGLPTAPTGAALQLSSSGFLGFNNSGDKIYLRDANRRLVTSVEYGPEAADGVSLTRAPEIVGPIVPHDAGKRRFTPGRRQNGRPFHSGKPAGHGKRSARIVINEILPLPADGIRGDANGDGRRDGKEDEFIELVNTSESHIDLDGWLLGDRTAVRHVFPPGTALESGQALVVFGGGDPGQEFGGAVVQTASSGFLGLNNTEDAVVLRSPDGLRVLTNRYRLPRDAAGQSLNRSPDLRGPLRPHTSVSHDSSAWFSPGTRSDGEPFLAISVPNRPPQLEPLADTTVVVGRLLEIALQAVDPDGDSLTFDAFGLPGGASLVGTLFRWTPLRTGLFTGIRITVSDGRGGLATGSFTILVQEDIGTPLVLNELLADPPAGATGDVNRDGTRHSTQDEFVELVNVAASPLDVGGWTLSDAASVRHQFPDATVIPAQGAIVVFGGGAPLGLFGSAIVQTASSGSLSLNNGGDSVIVRDASGGLVFSLAYDGRPAPDQSLTRDPDLTGPFAPHTAAAGAGGAAFSPGTMIDGSAFAPARQQTKSAVPLQRADSLGTKLLQNYPNPFNPATTLVYELPAAGEVRLTVYDLRGRVVRTLVDAYRRAGKHRVRWNATNAAGSRVSSGIYIARLRGAETRQDLRIIYMR